jgi:predicted nucleic acid-binding protein
MKYLLDVNVLLAAVWTQHPQHPIAFAWLAGKETVV